MISQRLSLLVIDDDAFDRKQIRRLSARAGLDWHIHDIQSVSQIDSFDPAAIDAVLVDYRMPDVDGFTAILRVRERFQKAAVIVVTGQGDEAIAAGSFQAGVEDYVPKHLLNESSLQQSVASAVEKCRLRRKLETQRRDLEIFAHVLVHDLRAPIRHANLLAALIREAAEIGDIAAVASEATTLEAMATRMSELIASLSRHLRVDAPMSLRPTSLNEAVAAAVQNLRIEIEEVDARIEVEPLPEIVCDAAQVTQLFQNLISNSIKFRRGPRPRLWIRALESRRGDAVIAVADDGIGVPPDFREKMFEPFRRLHGVDAYPGSGLGLATCRRIVERHGGEIRCEPAEGAGASIVISLPRAPVGAEEVGAISAPVAADQVDRARRIA